MRIDREGFNFKERVEKLVSEPITWQDLHIAWCDMKVEWKAFEKPIGFLLGEYINTKDSEKQKTIELIIKGWLEKHKDSIREVFKDSTAYNNFVVQIAIQIMIGSNILGKWLCKDIIEKTKLEKEETKGYKGDIYFNKKELESEATVKLVKIVNDLKLTTKRIEPYLKRAIINAVKDWFRKETLQERYTPQKIGLDKGHEKQDISQEEDEDVYRNKIEYKIFQQKEKRRILNFSDLAAFCSKRQLEIIVLKKNNLDSTWKDIAGELGVSERTIRYEIEALRNNRKLRDYLKS